MDLDVTARAPHGVRVHLAHVPSSVYLLDVGDVKLPLLVLPVRKRNSLVPCDDAVVDCKDGLSVNTHPSYLKELI